MPRLGRSRPARNYKLQLLENNVPQSYASGVAGNGSGVGQETGAKGGLGSAAGNSSGTGIAAGAKKTSGIVAGVASGTGVQAGAKGGQAAVAGPASGTGQETGQKNAIGSFAGYASGTGIMGIPPVTSLSGVASATGQASGAKAVSEATAPGVASGTGVLAGAKGGAGTIGGPASGTGTVGAEPVTLAAGLASGTGASAGAKGALSAVGGPASGTGAVAGTAARKGSATGVASGTGKAAGTKGAGAAAAGATSGTGKAGATAKRHGTVGGYASGAGAISGIPVARIVNQWAGTFSQPAAFTSMPPALQSTVIALDGGTSVGGGSGTPTAGNWLVCIAGWNQAGLPAATVGDADDIHSFWRAGNVTTSNWAVSTSSGNTRTSVWYTPNLARVPGNVYVAPSGAVAGQACLVFEISGLSPWDTVTGIATNYAAAATSLTLALPAPSAPSAVIGAVTGDLTGASQAFAPSGWTTLATVTADDGSDHLCDTVLTSAFLPLTSGSVSVSASASSATDLSGVLIAFEVGAPSPIPASQNPDWPYLKFEAAFGGGFQTPPDQLTWYDLSNRLWSWDETTGVQYQLGELQATNLDLELDNFDNALASDYPGSPYYSNAVNANMSFQSGISPWTETGSSTLAWSSAQSWSSSPGAVAAYSLQVTPNGSTANPGAVSEHITVSASTAYSASAWFYSTGGYSTGAQVATSWYTSGGTLISTATSSAVAVPAATWTQVTELNQASPSNAATAVITVRFSGTPSATAFWVAEAALNPGASVVSTGLVTTGTPLRIRAAIGTIGGVTANRWYVIQRNAEEWPQQIDSAFRRFVSVTATDIWSATSDPEPTPYGGEITQDKPYAWWPCDDPTGLGGVLPVTLRNAALGNTNTLNVHLSPDGGGAQPAYLTDGTSLYEATQESIAIYAVAQQDGWMYGDPRASQNAYGTTNPITASPGSAAWQASGQAGDTGSYGWFLSCNDSSFPALSGGVTVEAWVNYQFQGSTSSPGGAGPTEGFTYSTAQQPVCALTILELATGSQPVAVLQLNTAGNLDLITYDGSTGTSNTIYSSSDLRSSSWHHVAVELTTTTWAVYVNGGLTATVSGTATAMTSAWSWLILNGDLGANGGSTAGTGLVHGGNVAVSHVAVYPSLLPARRIQAHYCAAVAGFGAIPVPTGVSVTFPANNSNPAYTPDGSAGGNEGTYPGDYPSYPQGPSASAVVTATAGSYTSGPSAWAAGTAYYQASGYDFAMWVGWTGLAPSFNVYTASGLGSETEAAVVCGSGDSFTSGYGSGAAGHGVCQTGSGSGASPPTAASAFGDTVQQRIERCLGYGLVTYPGRCIDPAPLLVQAGTDIGGQATGVNLQNIADSDGGLMFVDNCSNLTYWQRPHLAGQYSSPVWTIDPASSPYYRQIRWIADPQRVWNAIIITPFAPDFSTLPLIVPQQAVQVLASQEQFGAQPLPITSYLQSQAEMQLQANNLFSNFGALHIRAENVKIDAAPDPALWVLTLGINVGDVVTGQMWRIGGGGARWTFRVSEIKRHIEFNGDGGQTTGSVTLKLDWEPGTYWS